MSDQAASAPSPNDNNPSEHKRSSIAPRVWGPIAFMFLVVLTIMAVYGAHERNVARQVSAQKSEVMAALDTTRGQISALTDRLNEMTAQQNAAKAGAASSENHAAKATRAATHRRREDPRWKELQNQLAEQQKQIEANRRNAEKCTGPRTDVRKAHSRLSARCST